MFKSEVNKYRNKEKNRGWNIITNTTGKNKKYKIRGNVVKTYDDKVGGITKLKLDSKGKILETLYFSTVRPITDAQITMKEKSEF